MESALYGVYTRVVLYQKSHSFASLTCSISDTPQLVCKHRTRALSMKYSIYTKMLGSRNNNPDQLRSSQNLTSVSRLFPRKSCQLITYTRHRAGGLAIKR